MKKLLFVFILVLAVVLIAGCNARKKNAEFEGSETATVVTTVEEANSEPLGINPSASEEPAETPRGELKVDLPGQALETSVGYHVIRGKTPQNTHAIQVNDYRLQKFRPGQTRWTYIASASIRTLQEGYNDYTVRALDAEGNELAKTTFEIVFKPGNGAPDLPGVGASPWLSLMVAFSLSFIGFVVRRRFYF